ncbi:MAG TPA: hypothetical protein VGD40_09980 [Chryseosolibacter sp.]
MIISFSGWSETHLPPFYRMKKLLIIVFTFATSCLSAQSGKLPYFELQDGSEAYTAGRVAARMIDGLGFRFYWATEGLRPADLEYKPGTDARTMEQTIAHIYAMSVLIVNSVTRTVNLAETESPQLPFEQMRVETLQNFKKASDILSQSSDKDLEGYKLMFKGNNQYIEFPFWNQLNGPIADCLWHVGQVVSFRRASGNPFTDKVSVLTGKVAGN